MKKLSLISLSTLFIFCLLSCKNRICCDIPPDCCYVPTTIAINVSNEKGVDLLDQSKIGSFKIDDIRVFHYFNNQNYFVVNSNNVNNLTFSANLQLMEFEVLLSNKISEDKSTTIIRWNNLEIDTIDSYFDHQKKLSKLIINNNKPISIDGNNYKLKISLVK